MSKEFTIYFIGIGGVGMSALAGIFKDIGFNVIGSDARESIITENLKKLGIQVFISQNFKNISDTLKENKIKFAVATTAITTDNPEILELKKNNIPVLTYPQSLGILLNVFPTIGIAGTHGKTTTTAIVTQLLTELGEDPYALIGALFRFLDNKNYRLSTGNNIKPFLKSKIENVEFTRYPVLDINLLSKDILRWETDLVSNKINEYLPFFVVEADEYKNAFLNYQFEYLLIPAIDYDHADFFKTKEEYFLSFAKAIVNTKRAVILDVNNRNSQQVLKIARGLSDKLPQIVDWRENTGEVINSVYIKAKFVIEDATVAFTLGKKLGYSKKELLNHIKNFNGVWRRFEIKNPTSLQNRSNPVIVSDYAHNPQKVSYALEALGKFAEQYKFSKVLIIFQAHQYYRLYSLEKDFIAEFSKRTKELTDLQIQWDLWITDVYGARSSAKDRKLINAKIFAKHTEENGINNVYTRSLKNTKKLYNNNKDKYDVILLLSAGDLENILTP